MRYFLSPILYNFQSQFRFYNGSDFARIFDGSVESPCLKPCKFTGAAGKFLSKKGDKTYSQFDLSINQEVTITRSYIPEFSVSTFIADLGGSLGLWLGVGAVQLLSSGLGLLTWIRDKLAISK